ncbi:hypothetical protein [uncultured Veillonella sp.]|uniref:hypothetical protein n=1 Tax=uncultured Veillonella sp. TaxID=159268 RepID=UPI0028041C1D|nr:hypothetical protein [uncultured Veillonella sp.]
MLASCLIDAVASSMAFAYSPADKACFAVIRWSSCLTALLFSAPDVKEPVAVAELIAFDSVLLPFPLLLLVF